MKVLKKFESKFTLVLRHCRMYFGNLDYRNRLCVTSGNDWCLKKLLDICCKLFKYPSSEAKASTSPSRGEGCNNLFSNVINGLRPVNLDYRIKSVNDRNEEGGASGDGRREECVAKRFAGLCPRMTVNLTSPAGGEVTGLLRCARNDIHCLGRSMIEMLGVLAIIGVLSVGGIAGYSKAMEKFKVNKLVYDFNMLVRNMLEYESSLLKIGENDVNLLADTLYSLDMIPSSWKKLDSRYIEDSLGNWLNIYNRNEKSGYGESWQGIVIDYMLGGMSADEQGNYVSGNFNSKLCFELFNTVIIPLHNVFKRGRVNPGDQYIYYGDAYCGISPTHCLKDLTFSQINEMCNSCSGTVRCNITVNF